ncbi:MAG: VWA domain-containing protein [Thermoanaerobaculia bacterium]
MTRKRLPLAALLLLAAPAFAAAPPNAPSFGATVDVDVVNVDVFVTDKDGRRVTGLKKGDFELQEDGKAVGVSNFAEITPAGRPARGAAPSVTGSGGLAPAAPAAAPPEAAPDPQRQLSLVVFVDNLHLRPQNRTRAVEQIRKFLAQSVRPGDRVMIATYDNNMHVRRPFTGDPAEVDATLREVERLPTYGQQEDAARRTAYQSVVELDAMVKCSKDMVRPVEAYADQMRGEAVRTLAALTVVINSLSGVPGHRALLFVSDGISVNPGEELYQAASELCDGSINGTKTSTGDLVPLAESKSESGVEAVRWDPRTAALDARKYSLVDRFQKLAAHASSNRVTFYTLQASGLEGFATADAGGELNERGLAVGVVQQIQLNNLKSSLTELAVDTGGRAMLDVNDFLPELARMQEDFESYYSLGYSPGHAGDGKDHRIEVKVRKPGLQVRYRQTYRDKPLLEKLADRTLAALFHGFEENPLEVQIEIGDPAPAEDGQYAVPVRLRIPLFKLAILNQQESYQGKLRLLVATRDEKGGASAVRQVEVPLNIPRKEVLSALGQYYLYTLTLKMQPGAQHVAVAVRDELAAATSYLTRPVQVGAVASR